MASPGARIGQDGGGSGGGGASSARRVLLGLLTASISLALCLVVAEVSVRILKRATAFQPDPDLIRSRLPYKEEPISTYETEDNLNGRSSEIPERPVASGNRPTNNLGLRMTEDVGPKRPDERRILLLGDSFTEALEYPADRRFDGVAERILGTRDAEWGRWRIINAGIQNGSPVQYLLMLRRFLPLVEPDIVVVVTGANDLWDDVNFERQYGIELDEDGVPLRPRKRTELWLLQKSFLLRYLSVFLHNYAPGVESIVFPPWDENLKSIHWTTIVCSGSPEVPPFFEARTGRHLLQIDRMVAESGAKLAVLVMHYLYTFDDEPFYEPRFPGLKQEVVEAGCYELRGRPYRELVGGFLARHGIPYRDTFDAFLAAKRELPSRKLWNFHDYHFSPAGHAVMGAELVELLSRVRGASGPTSAAFATP